MHRSLTALALGAALLPGCGGGGDDEPGRTVSVAAGERVSLVGDEYSFDPEGVVVGGPGRIEISLRNDGVLAHNVRVFRGAQELGGTPAFQRGKELSATLDLEPGDYRLVCTVGDHEALGMTGTLRVEE